MGLLVIPVSNVANIRIGHKKFTQIISVENYEEWKVKHQPVCPAKYSQFTSFNWNQH